MQSLEVQMAGMERDGDANAQALATAVEKAIQPGITKGGMAAFDAVTNVGLAWQQYCGSE
jgi:hypothetical protein